MPSPTTKELIDQLQRTQDAQRLAEVFIALCSKGRRGVREAQEACGLQSFLALWRKAGSRSAARLLEAVLRSELRHAGDGGNLVRELPAAEMGRKAVEFVQNRRFDDAAFILGVVPEVDPETLLQLSRAYLDTGSPRDALVTIQRALASPAPMTEEMAVTGALAAARLGDVEEATGLLTRGFAGRPQSLPSAAPALCVLARSGAELEADHIVSAVGGSTPQLEQAICGTAAAMARADLRSAEELLRTLNTLLGNISVHASRITDPRILPEETGRAIEAIAGEGLDRCMGLTRLFEAWQGPVNAPVKARLLLLNLLTVLTPGEGARPETSLDEDTNGRIVCTDDSLLSFALRETIRAELAAGGRRVVAGCSSGPEGHDELRFSVGGAPEEAPSEWRSEVARRIFDELGVRFIRESGDTGVLLRLMLPKAAPGLECNSDARELTGVGAIVRRATQEERRDTAEVLSFLVHDLKNGYSFIGHWAEEIEPAKHPLATIQERIFENITKMEGYIDECLKYLALQGETSVELFSLEEAVHEVARMLGGSCAQRGIGLSIETAPGLPSYRGQRDRILSVLLNLAKNSLEAMDGPGQLKLSVRLDETGRFELQVSDNGPGLAPDAQKRLFQLGGKPVRGTGRGIGLWAVRRHLERENGSITVESGGDRGTTFRIFLPSPGEFKAPGGEPDAARLEAEASKAWRAAAELSALPSPPWDTIAFLLQRAVQIQFTSLFRPIEKRGSLAATALKLIETGPKGSRRGRVLPGLVQHMEAKFPWVQGGAGPEEHLRRVLRAVLDDNLDREIEGFRSMAIWLLTFGRSYRAGGAVVTALVTPQNWTDESTVQLADGLVCLDKVFQQRPPEGEDQVIHYGRLREAAGRVLRLMQGS